VYIGALAPWNRVDYILSMFEHLSGLDASVRFAIYTSKLEEARRMVGGRLEGKLRLARLRPEELLIAAAEFDYGVIIRDRSVINQVAAPIKVGEYLAAGLKIIGTDSIGDYSEWIVRERLGVIVSGNSAQADARAIVVGMTERPTRSPAEIQAFARTRFAPSCRARQVVEAVEAWPEAASKMQ
jgi:glycosyltransferase involved in cell wall biosynthesis